MARNNGTSTQIDALPLILSAAEARQVLRVSRAVFYNLCKNNAIPHIRAGKQIRVGRDALFACIASGNIATDNR